MRIKKSYTEDELNYGVITQNRQVLIFLCKEYRSMIRWMVLNMGGSSEEAKDVFQDTVITLLRITQKPGFKHYAQ